MDWDGKPEIQQHGGKADNRLLLVGWAVVALGIAGCVYLFFFKNN